MVICAKREEGTFVVHLIWQWEKEVAHYIYSGKAGSIIALFMVKK